MAVSAFRGGGRPEGDTTPVGRQIRELRLRQRLTQTELARRIGIQQSDLSRMEKGEYRVPLDVLFRLLAALQVSITEFFGERQTAALTPAEEDMLHIYRALTPARQHAVDEFLRFQWHRQTVDGDEGEDGHAGQ